MKWRAVGLCCCVVLFLHVKEVSLGNIDLLNHQTDQYRHHRFRRSSDINHNVRKKFSNLITEILLKMKEKQFCFIIHDFLKKNKVEFHKLHSILPSNILKRKEQCVRKKSFLFNADPLTLDDTVNMFNLTAHVYNFLPLTVQCAILIEATVDFYNYYPKTNIPIEMRYVINDTYYKNQSYKAEYLSKIGSLIEKVEKILDGDDLVMTSGRQCKNILLNRKAYNTQVKYYVRHRNFTTVSWAKDQIRSRTPKIAERYSNSIGKPPPLSPVFAREADSFYFPQFLGWKTTAKDHIFRVHYFPIVAHGRPMNSHLIMASLYNFGIRRLKTLLGMDIRFRAVRDQSKLDYGVLDFPHYLKTYFDESAMERKCLYVDIIAGYTNRDRLNVITGFHVHELAKSDLSICSQLKLAKLKKLSSKIKVINLTTLRSKANRSNKDSNEEKKEEEERKKEKLNSNSMKSVIDNKNRRIHNTNDFMYYKTAKDSRSLRLNNLEIIMIVALALVFLLSTLFFTVCAVYVRRKRKHRGHVIRVIPITETTKSSDVRNPTILYVQRDFNNEKCIGKLCNCATTTSVNSIEPGSSHQHRNFNRNILKKSVSVVNNLESKYSRSDHNRMSFNNENNTDYIKCRNVKQCVASTNTENKPLDTVNNERQIVTSDDASLRSLVPVETIISLRSGSEVNIYEFLNKETNI